MAERNGLTQGSRPSVRLRLAVQEGKRTNLSRPFPQATEACALDEKRSFRFAWNVMTEQR